LPSINAILFLIIVCKLGVGLKAGVDIAKQSYDLSRADRGLSNPPETDKTHAHSDNDVIKTDKKTNNDEINLNLSNFEKSPDTGLTNGS
tara:strand:- start:47855 stop:48121 length:267 start_codon:yes stop_codon:yes gene_type:complete